MKDFLRDYATEAFRFYARNGKSAEKFRQMVYEKALDEYKRKEIRAGTGISKPTESAIMAAEREVENKLSAIKDMEAIELTLSEIKANEEKYYGMLSVIEIVYFTDAEQDLKKGDIQDRVHKAEFSVHISERNVYRCLRKARMMFAEKRGLRIYL